MKTLRFVVPLLAAAMAVALICPSSASAAAITTYSNRSDFAAAANSLTTVDFGSDTSSYGGSSLTFGDVEFTQAASRLMLFTPSYYHTWGLTSAYLNENGANNGIGVSFAHPVTAVGMELGYLWDYCHAGPAGQVTITLDTGDVLNASAAGPLYDTYDTLAFFGFTSDTPITSLGVVNPSGTLVVDDFAFGTAEQQVPEVPEPASLLLLASGLAAARTFRRTGRA